jgi:Fe-S cluster biogenesis protein NfuA
MAFYIHIQQTPNPDAIKFISQYTVRSEGRSTYKALEEAVGNPLAQRLFAIDGVRSLYFFDNYITVTREPGTDWTALSRAVHDQLQELLPAHDPAYVDPADQEAAVSTVEKTPEILQIDEILDRTVRPYLAADGGGIEVVGRTAHQVLVKYHGACGSCPSSIGGTLQAIQNILRDEIDPDLEVIEVGGAGAMFGQY